MSQLSNQFSQTTEKGMLTPSYGGVEASFNAQVVSTETTALVPAQPVKLSDTASGQMVVTAITAVTDSVFGFIPLNVRIDSYAALDNVKIATSGSVMMMEASAAIARGATVEAIIAGQKVVTKTTGTALGTALDKATADGDLIRVAITTIGQ